MQDRFVLVRATIQSKTEFYDANGVRDPQSITNHYDAIVKTVYVNNAGARNVIEGKTIKIRAKIAGNLCGIQLETGSDMLLDLYPESNGEYFSTSLCSMNARIDANGFIETETETSDYNECFTYSSTSDSLLMNAIPTLTVTEEGTKEEEDTTEDETPKPKLTKAELRRERRERQQERRERKRQELSERRNGTN
jgi:hypothetical protein